MHILTKFRSIYIGGGAYTCLHLTDELTGGLKEKLPFQFMRSNARKKSKSGIGFGFPVVVYTYETPGRVNNWVVLFKVPQGIHTDHPGFILCISDAAKNAPIFLLRQETIIALI